MYRLRFGTEELGSDGKIKELYFHWIVENWQVNVIGEFKHKIHKIYRSLDSISWILLSTASELYCFSNLSTFFSSSSSFADLPAVFNFVRHILSYDAFQNFNRPCLQFSVQRRLFMNQITVWWYDGSLPSCKISYHDRIYLCLAALRETLLFLAELRSLL